jgi:hypothetical protein
MCLTLPYTLCLMLAATVIAFVRFVRGRQQVMWERISPTESRPAHAVDGADDLHFALRVRKNSIRA